MLLLFFLVVIKNSFFLIYIPLFQTQFHFHFVKNNYSVKKFCMCGFSLQYYKQCRKSKQIKISWWVIVISAFHQ